MDPATAKAVEQTAKAADKALTVIHDTGGYLRELVGDLPKNAVGLLGADWLGQKRVRNLDAMMRRTEAILRERDAQAVDQLSPNIATELLSGAQEEGRDELIELWARLLANALDANMNSLRHSFIDAVKRMDPPDALLVHWLYSQHYNNVCVGHADSNQRIGTMDIARNLTMRQDAVLASLEHLTNIGILGDPSHNEWQLTGMGREFARVCYPEHDQARL